MHSENNAIIRMFSKSLETFLPTDRKDWKKLAHESANAASQLSQEEK